jgi:hypothetical protein
VARRHAESVEERRSDRRRFGHPAQVDERALAACPARTRSRAASCRHHRAP